MIDLVIGAGAFVFATVLGLYSGYLEREESKHNHHACSITSKAHGKPHYQ